MMPGAPEQSLLARIPFHRVLSGLLRLLLSTDQREEFLGDLVEEANLRLRTSTPGEVAVWMWSQILRSAPVLVGWRLRRLAARAQPLPSSAGLLVASRAGHRGWTLSLALSLSAHAVVLLAVVSWVFWRVDEIEPRFSLDLSTGFLLDPPPVEEGPRTEPGELTPATVVQARARRLKIIRRPVLPTPAAEPAPADPVAAAPEPSRAAPPEPADGPSGPPSPVGGRHSVVFANVAPVIPGRGWSQQPRVVPPQVGEKRCLSCPPPQLPHPYARLGVGQELLIKTCVNVKGEVSSVEVLHGVDPVIDARVEQTVRGWRLAPYSLDGHPVPFCYRTRFLFTTH